MQKHLIYKCPRCHHKTDESKPINFCSKCGNPLFNPDEIYSEDESEKIKNDMYNFFLTVVIFILIVFILRLGLRILLHTIF